jgi:hypothetical protein
VISVESRVFVLLVVSVVLVGGLLFAGLQVTWMLILCAVLVLVWFVAALVTTRRQRHRGRGART